jgi:hypothetical protein
MASSIERAMTDNPIPLMNGEDEEVIEVEIMEPEEGTEEEQIDVPFEANLAEHMEEAELTALAGELIEDYERDKSSRAPWERAYVKGLKLLGLEMEERTEPWAGASGVFHPILAEAVIRFQAESITETFPASGPVMTNIIGKETPEKVRQAKRVKDDMNYYTTEIMTEYRKEHEKLLLNVGLSGSGFKKMYFDSVANRPVSLFVPAEDFVVAYGASDLASCPRYTHVLKQYKNDIIKAQYAGMYKMMEVGDPSPEYSETEKAEQKTGGYQASIEHDDRHTLLEMHCDYDLEGFEDLDEDGEETEIARPYVITVCKDTRQILSIYRNWREADETKTKEQFFIPYEYVPGLGFYGIGLIHLLGSIAKSATSILRQLSDAGTLANLPGGIKARGLRIKGDDSPIRPGEWRDADIPAGSVRDNFLPLPYKEPSAVLYQLLGGIVQEGRTVASIADMKISDMNNQAPVGTTLAIIERGMKVMSAVNARIHASMRQELKLLATLIKEHGAPEYEYEVEEEGATRAQDYDKRVDVLPVSDPNASTLAQRIMQYQAALQLSQQAPGIYDLKELHRQMIDVLGLHNAEKIVPLEADMKPVDPVTENMAILSGKPVKAFLAQDHEAHITVHMAAIEDPKIQQLMAKSPMAQAVSNVAAAHIQEHIGFQYRVEIEKNLGVALPDPEAELPPEVEANLSKLIQDAATKLLQKNKEEEANRKIAQEQGDPIIQMQKQEVAAKVAEVSRKATADQLRAKTAADQLAVKKEVEAGKLAAQIGNAQGEAAAKDALESKRLAVEIANNQADNRTKEDIARAELAVQIANDQADNQTKDAMNRAKVAGSMIEKIMDNENKKNEE